VQLDTHRNNTLAAKATAYKVLQQETERNTPCVEKTLLETHAQATPVPSLFPQSMFPEDAIANTAPSAVDLKMLQLANEQRDLAIKKNAKLLANIDRVNKFIDWYAQRREYLQGVTQRAGPYLYHIAEALKQHQLPLDLALLPIVESAYQPTAKSPASAAGLWQFMPATGEDYHLQQTADYDERLDITESTEAALRYLGYLKQHYKGDWLLALAAYNCGIGRVDAAINRNIADGLDTDFWSLSLPNETQDYVPRFLALAAMFENPSNYHLQVAAVRDEPHFISVVIDRKEDLKLLAQKDLKMIAELANVGEERFAQLNPGFLSATLPADRPVKFLLPAANANQLLARFALLVRMETAALRPKAQPETFELQDKGSKQPLLSEWRRAEAEFLTLPVATSPP
jgi:soluble lytic murein transglycosylase-like protein